MYVEWKHGEAGGVKPEWLKLLWTLIDVSERSTRDLLHEWPLLPTTRGALVSCSIFSSVLCLTRSFENVRLRRRLEGDDDEEEDVPPGVLKSDESTKEKNSTSTESPKTISEQLHMLLDRLRAPNLELAYFPKTSISTVVLENENISRLSSIVLKALYVLHRAKGSVPALQWKEMSTNDRLTLLDLFAKDPAILNSATLSALHLDSLTSLPLFVRLKDEAIISIRSPEKYVTLDSKLVDAVKSKDESATTAKALMSLGNVATNFIIRSEKPDHNRLLVSMGVHEVNESTTLVKFIFPNFHNLSEKHRDDVMDRVVKTTPLRQDSKIISALKPLSFISVDGKHFKASDFYDPRVTFFKQMLRPEKFPPRDKYTTTEWLELLGSLGLITEVNADMILMCARSIHRSNDKNVMKAEYFVQYMWSHCSDFWSLSLCEQLSKLKFVPVRGGVQSYH